MIIVLKEDSKYFSQLEKNFPKVISKNLKEEISTNKFTQYSLYIIDDKPVAFLNYYIMYERAEIININVLEEYQNQNIASQLLESMLEEIKDKGVNSITLEVRKNNDKAIHLYEKYGFKKIGIRKGYYQGIDGILMEKELM